MGQKLAIPFGTQQGGGDSGVYAQITGLDRAQDFQQDLLMQVRIAYNSTFAHLAFAHLKLRFD